ncbi:MlaD family protein [Synechococcus sp. UW86]|uniref:MlaD family protein n=1 Tax=Synechococcus sp. UW86 TaxID=368491 RepID=UPI000E0FD179|nr:MlaD family protein [Synechococcus sp. UW86]
MRRSVRDAIVGFTLIGGIIGFSSTALWLRGVRLGSSHWTLTARFNDAAGMAERSPVTYRGILVGSVRSISVTSESVVAELEINKADLRLPLPVTATVGSASLLGGSARVALVSSGTPLPPDAPLPQSPACQPTRQLCSGETVVGQEVPSLSKLLAQVQGERVIPNVAASLEQIEATTKSFELLTVRLQDELVKAGPVIRNLELATAHINNIVASLDNPQTLHELKQTAANAAQLTATIDAVGGDVVQLTGDPEFMEGVRNLTIGLGELFGEIYPAQTAP